MVTLKDIAKRANVNVSTVSRALNDSSEINEDTKKMIRAIAAEMHYTPNMSARALTGKGTMSIGIIIPEVISGYFAQMVNFIEEELKAQSYSLIVGMTHHDYREEIHYMDVFAKRKVDGIILAFSMYKELEKSLHTMKNHYKMPMVLIQTFKHFPDYDYIVVDDMQGIDSAIRHLYELGHRDIGFIADQISSKLRFEAFKQGMKNSGLKVNDRFVKIGNEMFEEGGYLQAQELLNEKEMPTAIFAGYDHMAIGAMRAFQEHGLRVPEDISIIGYDNIREGAYLPIPLTTVSPPIRDMTRVGVKLLLDKIKEKDNAVIQHVSLKPELIIRNTTGACSKRNGTD